MSIFRFLPDVESSPRNRRVCFRPLPQRTKRLLAIFALAAMRQRVMLALTARRIIVGLVTVIIFGCGGGDDFSQPIARMSNPSTKPSSDGTQKGQGVKQDPAPTQANIEQPSSNPTDTKVAQGELSSAADSTKSAVAPTQPAPKVESSTSGVETSGERAVTGPPENSSPTMAPDASRSSSTVGKEPVLPEVRLTPPASSQGTQGPPKVPAEPDQADTITASGRTAKAISEKQNENSKMTVAENAGGLLGSLKSNKSTPTVNAAAMTGDYDAPQILSRFGRMALSQPDWLRLVTRLSRRFYVGVSLDGSRILASSGKRSGGVIQIDETPDPLGRFATSERSADYVLQTITSLPAQISCLELTGDGTAALFGTDDGRVLVRIISGKEQWDLYARDFFLFQDEIRASARLGTDPIILLREIGGGQLLSINAKGLCGIWKIADIIQAVPPIESISVDNIDSLSSITVNPEPVVNFEIKGFQILSCCESTDGQWVAIVSSDETITIVETQTGVIVDRLNADHFADTQPVTVAFLPGRQEILAGLADGRILRRAFGKDAAPVSGVNDAGEPVDYYAVFIPDVKDRPDPVTTIVLIPGTTLAYVGSLTGTISRLDISQRSMELQPFRQNGAILEMKVSSFGVVSIDDERHATIFDQPISAITRQVPAPRTLELPTDETLNEANAGEPGAAGTRRPTSRAASLRESASDPEMLGIRPANHQLALLQHQLRTAVTESQRQSIRRAILTVQGRDVRVLDAPANLVQEDDVTAAAPVLLAEFAADYDFKSHEWQDVRMYCAMEGRIAVLSHASRPGISIVDMPTGVVLRRWTGIPGPRQLLLNEQRGRLVPSGPAAAELYPATGAVQADLTRQYLVCALSPDRHSTILGHFGTTALAADTLTRIDDVTSTRTSTHEMFESMVTALAYSPDGKSLYAAVRGRDQTTLQELDPSTLSILSTLVTEPLPGAVPRDFSDALEEKSGTTFLLSSESNRSLLTYGTFEDGPQLRLWRRSSTGWPKEDVLIFRDEDQLPDAAVVSPVVFVNQMESKLAVVTKSGLSILNTKKERLESHLPIPDIVGRRPSCCFTPNAKWIFVGDAEGTIWVRSLISPTRKPLTFQAHSGPIAGLSISADGKFLLTAGEDNRIRSWSLGDFLGP